MVKLNVSTLYGTTERPMAILNTATLYGTSVKPKGWFNRKFRRRQTIKKLQKESGLQW